MNKLAHDYDCTIKNVDYLTSGCSSFCDFQKEAVRECVDEGQHFKQTQSVNGYDVCFNCGGMS